MNKKLIAIGIAAALAVPFTAAQAGVEVYGKIRTSLDFNNNNDGNSSNTKDNMSLSSNASRLGFKGDEDLGNGLTAMWQLEMTANFDGGDSTSPTAFGSERMTYIGVGGGFGTVLAGRLDTPYKSSTDKYDIFVDTKADFNGIMGNVDQNAALYDLRTNNTVAYITPNMSGFSGKLAYVMPSTITGSDNLQQTKAQNKQDAYDIGVGYDMGPLSLIADYITLARADAAVGGAGNKDLTAWKVGGSYTIMDATTLALIYETADAAVVSGSVKSRAAYYFAASHKMGDTTLKLAIGYADKIDSTSKTGATQSSIGVAQALTKNTEVYALYSMLDNDSNGAYGMAYGPGNATVGKDESVFSVGINHNFSSK